MSTKPEASARHTLVSDLLDTTNVLLFVVKALAKQLGIDPETTEFRFTVDGKPLVTVNLAQVYERADAAIAKAIGSAA